jgi:biotin carboxyl carrier protein
MKLKWKVPSRISCVGRTRGVIAQHPLAAGPNYSTDRDRDPWDLTSLVSASGEIKPRTYTNLGANAQGRIIALEVKEGDHVRKGQMVARIESVQATADVQAQRASVASSEADSAASRLG